MQRALLVWAVLGLLAGWAWCEPGGVAPRSSQPEGWSISSDSGARVYTLGESLEIGLRQNPQMRVATEAVVQAVAQYEQARSAKNPSLVFSDATTIQRPRIIDTSGFFRTIRAPHGFPTEFDVLDPVSSQISMALDWLLTSFGNVENQIAAALIQTEVETLNVETEAVALRFQIKQAFLQRLQADSSVAVAEENLVVSRQSLSDTDNLFQQGLQARYDVVQAELQVQQAQQQLEQARTSVGTSTASFLTLLNEPGRGPVQLVAPPPITIDASLTLEDLEELALASRPEVRSMERSIAAAGKILDAARSSSMPTVSLRLGYDTSMGNALRPADQYGLTFQFSWPLFDGGLSEAKSKQAESQIRSLEASDENQRLQIRLQVDQAWLQLLLTGSNLATAAKQVETAEVYYAMATQRYKVGLTTTLEVQQAVSSLNEARQNLVVTNYQRDLAFAALEQSLGRDFPDRVLSLTEHKGDQG
ncbi:MAG: TolC family protein [Armatimonadetes bacterium]|nr:TolC family protein [Armatimonadota bacterium]